MMPKNRATWQPDVSPRCIQEAFDSPRYFVSYRRSLEVGDASLNAVDSVAIENPSHPLGEPSVDLAGG